MPAQRRACTTGGPIDVGRRAIGEPDLLNVTNDPDVAILLSESEWK
jgi:hypothetical protein